MLEANLNRKLRYISKTIVNCMKLMRSDAYLMKLILSKKNEPLKDETITPQYVKDRLTQTGVGEKTYNDILAPFPFNETAKVEEETNVRVYSSANYFIENGAWLESTISFDVLTPKSQWLIKLKEEGSESSISVIRPYEIVARIVNIFNQSESIDGVYKLKFDGFSHISIGTGYEGIRVYAKVHSLEAKSEG